MIKFVASKTVTGETDPRMFGSFVFNDNVSEIIRPKGMKVTFLKGRTGKQKWVQRKEHLVNNMSWQWDIKCVVGNGWIGPYLRQMMLVGIFFNGRAQGVNWRMIRYSDVLLMYAEAVVMGGKATANITPLEAINKVRDRVGVPHVTEANMRTIEDETYSRTYL